MAGSGHTERGSEVEILFTFGIPNMHPTRAGPDDGPRSIRFDKSYVPRFVTAKERKCLGGGHDFGRKKSSRIISNPPRLRRPDHLMKLRLKADGQRVGNNRFGQLLARYRRLVWRRLFQRLVLLARRERMHPGE